MWKAAWKERVLVSRAVIHFINPALWNEILFPWTERAWLECLELEWIKHFFIVKHKLLVQLCSSWNEKVFRGAAHCFPGRSWSWVWSFWCSGSCCRGGLSVQGWDVLMEIPGLLHEEDVYCFPVMKRGWAPWHFCVCVKTNSVPFLLESKQIMDWISS